MNSESQLPFTVQQISGGLETYSAYGQRATQILSLAYPEIASIASGEVKGDFSSYNETVFLLLHDDLFVGFSSYMQLYVCPVEEQEKRALSWTQQQWSENQSQTASLRWIAIDPQFQHRGGWTTMMNASDASLQLSTYRYQVQQVRKANHLADKVRARYTNDIVFQTDVNQYGPQTYFRIKIPRE